MATLPFNIAKGRAVQFYINVDGNSPAGCELVVAVLATSGIESDAVLIDKDTFADVVSGATNEVTNSGYAKKVLTGADLAAYAPDDANDRVDIDIPDQTWTSVAAGDGWNDIVTGYDPVGSQTASDIIPIGIHDFVIVPDGKRHPGADRVGRLLPRGVSEEGPMGEVCTTCGKPAEVWWDNPRDSFSTTKNTETSVARCERCCRVDQLVFARMHAEKVPALEKRIADIDIAQAALVEGK